MGGWVGGGEGGWGLGPGVEYLNGPPPGPPNPLLAGLSAPKTAPQLEVAAFLLLTYSVELDVGGGGSVVWHS